MSSILKLLLFIASNVGYWEIIRRNTKINGYFFPSITIAIQTTMLFIAGLLNILQESVVVLGLVGLLGLFYGIYRENGVGFLKNYFNVGYFFLAVTSLIMLIYVKGKIFGDYDNFSHWAIVVKSMINTNRFPNFEDVIIEFQEYPLGSSSYIYYVAKLVSTNESIWMFAQIYMMLACVLPIFSFCKKNKTLTLIVLVIVTNFFFVYNTSITSLLVDTLLPLVAMCSLLYMHFYCKADLRKYEMFIGACYLTWVIQIKNSGIFFVLLISLYIILNIKKDNNIALRLMCIAPPFISMLLWHKHCKYVFASAAASKHAMTITNYKSVFGEKTLEDIRLICLSLFEFAITYKDVWLVIFFILLTGMMIFLFAKKELFFWRRMTIVSFLLYIVYQLGVLMMYLFSMPGKEATSLAGSTRYTKTIIIAIIYLIIIIVVKMLSYEKVTKGIALMATALITILFSVFMKCSLGSVKFAIQYTSEPEQRNWIETAKKEYDIPNNESYCILIKRADAGYARYLGKYIFQTPDVGSVLVDDEEDLNIIDSKYIFLYDQDNEIVDTWVRNNYPEQFGNKVIVREEE